MNSAREELEKAGIYILTGSDPITNAPRAYIGEAEVIRERLKQHKSKEFWVSAIVFVSKDENLTKAHVRYLESRLLTEAAKVNRFTLEQNQAGGSKLPESDREDMEVFLSRIRQLLPVLGSDILSPISQPDTTAQRGGVLHCRMKGAEGRGQRTPNGFVVFSGSTAVLGERPSMEKYAYVMTQRKQLIAEGCSLRKKAFWSSQKILSSPVHLRRRQLYTVVAQMGSSHGKLKMANRSSYSTSRLNLSLQPTPKRPGGSEFRMVRRVHKTTNGLISLCRLPQCPFDHKGEINKIVLVLTS
jgi:hypothetical protein